MLPSQMSVIEPGYMGGGGSGGGTRGRGPQGMDPKELARLLRSLGMSSRLFFEEGGRVLYSEEVVGDLLGGAFQVLADAAEQGTLSEIVEKISAGAKGHRQQVHRQTLARVEQLGRSVEADGSAGKRVADTIRDCLVPGAPK